MRQLWLWWLRIRWMRWRWLRLRRRLLVDGPAGLCQHELCHVAQLEADDGQQPTPEQAKHEQLELRGESDDSDAEPRSRCQAIAEQQPRELLGAIRPAIESAERIPNGS